MSFRLKLVDRLILNEVVPVFIVGVVVFTSIVLVVASADIFNYLTQGVPLWIVIELIGFNILPWLVATFPMAILLACTYGFAQLSSQSGLVALFAAGIQFKRLMVPVIAFSVVVTGVALFTNDTLAPYANRQFDRLKANAFHELNQTTKPFDIPAIRDDHNHLLILAHVEGGYDITTRSMVDVYIFEEDPATGDIVAAIRAPRANWAGGSNWTLQNATVLTKGMYSPVSSVMVKDLRQPPDTLALLQNGPDELDFQELFKEIAELKASGDGGSSAVRDAEVSLWDKISLPFACFTFAIIGAPLGLRPPRTAALAVAIPFGLGIIFAYYALYQYMHVLGASGHANPAFAAFLPDLLALIVGLVLLLRSSS